MFWKPKKIAQADLYKKEFDWGAFIWAIVIGFFALGILGNLIGS